MSSFKGSSFVPRNEHRHSFRVPTMFYNERTTRQQHKYTMSRDSSIALRRATGCMIGVSSPGIGLEFSLSSLPHWFSGPHSFQSSGYEEIFSGAKGLKRPEGESDKSNSCSTEFKNVWRYNSAPQYIFTPWC